MTSAVVFDIQRFSVQDGPGIRTTVFLKGCHNRCPWCHNPESLSPAPQIMHYPERCIGCGLCDEACAVRSAYRAGESGALARCNGCGRCADRCVTGALQRCGRSMTTEEVLARILADRAYFDESGGGVTFSGGEPLLSGDFLAELLPLCRSEGLHIAVQTAGNLPFAHFQPLLSLVDLWMVDVKSADAAYFAQHIGPHFEAVYDNIDRLIAGGHTVLARTPVIGGVNDTPAAIGAIARRLSPHGQTLHYALLPYHSFGLSKQERLTGQSADDGFAVPSDETMAALRSEAARWLHHVEPI